MVRLDFPLLVADFGLPNGLSAVLWRALFFVVLALELNNLVKMNALSPAPEFDGRAGNFASYRQEMWPRATHVPLNRRAPALALAIDKMPSELCLPLGVGALRCDTGAETIMELLRKDHAPDASDTGSRDILGFFWAP